MANRAALGEEESQLLVTEEEVAELNRQVSHSRSHWTLLTSKFRSKEKNEFESNHTEAKLAVWIMGGTEASKAWG